MSKPRKKAPAATEGSNEFTSGKVPDQQEAVQRCERLSHRLGGGPHHISEPLTRLLALLGLESEVPNG